MFTNLWRSWEIHNACATGDVGTNLPLRRAVDEANTSWKISEARATPVSQARAAAVRLNNKTTSYFSYLTIHRKEGPCGTGSLHLGEEFWPPLVIGGFGQRQMTIDSAKRAAPTPAAGPPPSPGAPAKLQ
ncbi:hypothetical protein B0H14DRAFT_2599744 [Mycena olivaceomarginata]|nr:hypothetical protein B0H14DRAFT_2599744 [Mycena olivaceomarginata]